MLIFNLILGHINDSAEIHYQYVFLLTPKHKRHYKLQSCVSSDLAE